MKNILLVEDDDRLSKLVCDYLTQHEFQVKCLPDGSKLLEQVERLYPDLVILDVMLPGQDGFELCKQLRTSYKGPLLFMTARDDAFDQVLGLEIGADDYIVKPVEPRVLLARVHALLRRSQQKEQSQQSSNQSKLHFGKLKIDKNARKVTLSEQDIVLTSHEFDLLCMLAEHPAELVTRDQIYTNLIGREYDGLDRSADVRISRLRKKLHDNAQNPFRIKTIWGKGFFFVADAWND